MGNVLLDVMVYVLLHCNDGHCFQLVIKFHCPTLNLSYIGQLLPLFI